MLSRCTGACACSAWRCCDASRRLRPPRGLRRPRRPLVPGRTSLFRTTRRCPALPRTPRRRRPRKNIPPRSHPGNGTELKDKFTIFPRCETILLYETTNATTEIYKTSGRVKWGPLTKIADQKKICWKLASSSFSERNQIVLKLKIRIWAKRETTLLYVVEKFITYDKPDGLPTKIAFQKK